MVWIAMTALSLSLIAAIHLTVSNMSSSTLKDGDTSHIPGRI